MARARLWKFPLKVLLKHLLLSPQSFWWCSQNWFGIYEKLFIAHNVKKKRPQRGFTDPLHISVDQITTKPNRDLKQKTIRDHRVDYTPARISNCLECGTVVVIAANDSWKTLTSMIIPQLMSETSCKIFKVIWTAQYLNIIDFYAILVNFKILVETLIKSFESHKNQFKYWTVQMTLKISFRS